MSIPFTNKKAGARVLGCLPIYMCLCSVCVLVSDLAHKQQHSNTKGNVSVLWPDILKVDFLLGQNFSFQILSKTKCKNITKNHLICVKHEENNVKEVKIHKFVVCVYKSQDFAQSQKIFARSHDRETVIFRNSDSGKRRDTWWNIA